MEGLWNTQEHPVQTHGWLHVHSPLAISSAPSTFFWFHRRLWYCLHSCFGANQEAVTSIILLITGCGIGWWRKEKRNHQFKWFVSEHLRRRHVQIPAYLALVRATDKRFWSSVAGASEYDEELERKRVEDPEKYTLDTHGRMIWLSRHAGCGSGGRHITKSSLTSLLLQVWLPSCRHRVLLLNVCLARWSILLRQLVLMLSLTPCWKLVSCSVWTSTQLHRGVGECFIEVFVCWN